MVDRFIAEIKMATPLIANRLTGDSLLAGIAFQQHHDWERAIAELPIALVEGVPAMSMLLPYSLASRTTQRTTIYRSIMRDMDHDPDMASMLNDMPPKSQLNTASGPLRNLGSSYTARDLPKIYFMGQGDIDAVQTALQGVSFIGSQRARGFGQVASVSVWPVRNAAARDNKWFGIVGSRNGHNVVLRPVPQRLAKLLPTPVSHILSSETWHNPYHPSRPAAVVEPCLTPPFHRGESFNEHQIEDQLSITL